VESIGMPKATPPAPWLSSAQLDEKIAIWGAGGRRGLAY